jgi:hypothetical protein
MNIVIAAPLACRERRVVGRMGLWVHAHKRTERTRNATKPR